jgi:hypothetical protein
VFRALVVAMASPVLARIVGPEPVQQVIGTLAGLGV